MSRSLHSSEWFLVGSLFLILFSLVLTAKISAHRAFSSLQAEDLALEEVLVEIQGAVAKPGVYKVLSGTLLQNALRKARPKPNANLKKFALTSVVEAPLHLQVEELAEIAITVEGAVASPGQIVLPAFSRICDLKSKISFTPDTDRAFFKRKKVLRDGDVVCVPKKTIEDNSAD